MAKKANYSAAFKSKVAIEALREQSSIAELSQKYGISQMSITRWRQELLEHSSEIFSGTMPNEENHQKEVDRLHRKIGELEMKVDFNKFSIGCIRHNQQAVLRSFAR